MCCGDDENLDLPPAVIEMVARYRSMLGDHHWGWGGEELPDFFRYARFSLIGPVMEHLDENEDWARAIRSVIADEVPSGIVLIRVDAERRLSAVTGRPRPMAERRRVALDVVIDSSATAELDLTVNGQPVRVDAGAAVVETIECDDPSFTVALDGRQLVVSDALVSVRAAQLRLVSSECSRWSVTDPAGGAWFPDGILPKWDVHHRPYFHGDDVTLTVPEGPLHVCCTRGLEYDRSEFDIEVSAGTPSVLECEPVRLIDPGADGWYGGDLHVHLNYSGDLVCHPADAARMQRGEGLHLMNLTAGNLSTSLVFDRELLESTAGEDLPWTNDRHVARAGVEYRNDLLGHVHALGPSAPPNTYFAGHENSDHPDDWPPNKTACEELQGLGATVGYAHPAFTAFPEGSTSEFFRGRTAEARELIADAALGVVDSVDLISPFNDEGAIFLYHRLLSCGLRLAATAGTDAFLSFSHGPGVASNPPGWGRVYAKLGDGPPTAEGFKDAIRQGRTVVTNGVWLQFDVNGHGPGTTLDLASGDQVEVTARVQGPGATELTIVGPDGVFAHGDATADLHLSTTVDQPLWLAAIARGPGNPRVLDEALLAHTSPVYLDVAGQRVRRAADARWCLDFLDSFEAFVSDHGRFTTEHRHDQLRDLQAVISEARDYYRGLLPIG
jgi:hypothetical protein